MIARPRGRPNNSVGLAVVFAGQIARPSGVRYMSKGKPRKAVSQEACEDGRQDGQGGACLPPGSVEPGGGDLGVGGGAAGRPGKAAAGPGGRGPGGQPAEGSPLVIRGEQVQAKVGVHWLQVSVWAALEGVQALVERALVSDGLPGMPLDEAGRPVWVCKPGARGVCWELGTPPVQVVLYQYADSPEWWKVQLKGEMCEAVGGATLVGFLGSLQATGWRWQGSRVDLAVDGLPVAVPVAIAAAEAGQYSSKCFKSCSVYSDDKGWTLYLGQRHCDRFLRLYDARVGKGNVGARVELECKGDQAKYVAGMLLVAAREGWEGVPKFIAGELRRAIDFVDGASSSQKCRCVLLPWWDEFLGWAERGKFTAEPEGDRDFYAEVQRFARWVVMSRRQYGVGVAAFGRDEVVKRLDRALAEHPLTAEDLARAEELRKRGGALWHIGAGVPF